MRHLFMRHFRPYSSQGPNSSLKAQIPVLRAKSHPQGPNPILRPKSHLQGPDPNLERFGPQDWEKGLEGGISTPFGAAALLPPSTTIMTYISRARVPLTT